MQNLPDVVLLEVFKKLDYYDLCQCAQVCRRWNNVAKSRELKKSVIIKRYLTVQRLEQLFHFLDNVETFEFLNYGQVFWKFPMCVLLELEKRSPYLKKVVFMKCFFLKTDKSFPSTLQHLGVRNSFICIPTFISDLKMCSHLTCLDMTGFGFNCTLISSEYFSEISELKSLRCLYLSMCHGVDDKVVHSMDDILPQLYTLDVEGTCIQNDGISMILERCASIKQLYIGTLAVDGGALSNRSVRKLPNLDTLCVDKTLIKPIDIERFMTGRKRKINVLGLQEDTSSCAFTFADLDLQTCCNHYLSHSCPS